SASERPHASLERQGMGENQQQDRQPRHAVAMLPEGDSALVGGVARLVERPQRTRRGREGGDQKQGRDHIFSPREARAVWAAASTARPSTDRIATRSFREAIASAVTTANAIAPPVLPTLISTGTHPPR